MATRINNAKNFKGKSYVVTDELTNIINSLQYSAGTLYFTGNKVQDENGVGATTSAVDISDLISFITSGKVGGKIITTDSSGNFAYVNAITTTVASSGATTDTNIPNETAVRAAIDAVQQAAISVVGTNGITVSGEGTEKTIDNTIKLVKKATANTGYAASYQLMYQDGENYVELNGSDDIDIIKDQFLTNVELGYGIFVNADTVPTDWTTTKPAGETELNTILKLTFAIGAKDSSGAASDTGIIKYINVDGMFHDKVAGNYINATDLASNKITVVVGNGIDGSITSAIVVKADTSDKIYTTKGVETSVMSVTSNGVKASGIQAAIDLATENAYAKTSSAISAVNAQVETFESSVNSAIATTTSNVNAKVDGAVTNVNANVSAAVSAVNGKVDTAITNVNTAITSTVANVNGKVSSAVTAVNGKVDGAVSAVNDAVTTTVGAVNTAVGSAVSAVESNVASVVTNVNTAISATVSSVNTQVSAVASQVVQIVDDTIVITSDNISANETAQTVTLTGITGKVLAVYDADGIQIYPTIQKVNSTYTLTAEYGPSATVDSAWSVLHTSAVNYTNATVTPADGVTAAGYAPATVTSATAPEAVTYTNAEGVDASSVNAVSYTNASAGDAATAGTASYNNGTTVGALDYKD